MLINIYDFKNHQKLVDLGWSYDVYNPLVYEKEGNKITFYSDHTNEYFYILSERISVSVELAKILYDYIKEITKTEGEI